MNSAILVLYRSEWSLQLSRLLCIRAIREGRYLVLLCITYM